MSRSISVRSERAPSVSHAPLENGRKGAPRATKPVQVSPAATAPAANPHPPQRATVSGVLDQLTGTKREFRLLLSDGHTLRGTLPPGDLTQFAPLFNQRVTVDGEVQFRPSGAVAQLTADRIEAAEPQDRFWERIPRPRQSAREAFARSKPRLPGGLAAVYGQWPGDETEEELLAILKEME